MFTLQSTQHRLLLGQQCHQHGLQRPRKAQVLVNPVGPKDRQPQHQLHRARPLILATMLSGSSWVPRVSFCSWSWIQAIMLLGSLAPAAPGAPAPLSHPTPLPVTGHWVVLCPSALSTAFGKSIPSQGLLGLGRGPLSLLSQSEPLYSGVFSYCLPSFKSYYFSGSLKLGPAGQPRSIRTTPLLKNPHRPSLYYVNLTGISVGRILVPVPSQLLSLDPNTGAGTIIDSGTVITRFVEPVYNAIRDEFRKQVKGTFSSLGAFDTCFAATNEAVAPAITFHFQGLDLTLPLENSLIHSSAGTLACLAMAAAPNNVNSVLNVIANLQLQNLRILFDVANSRIGIARELCN
ncbi:Aspartyl protease [Quillaja saponaria]|uniref:Aspartyl protease n=1 Tax=Quillaja saponaria TaxID=32244 RepID=A0AAD7PS02_QUISA|nr:Aspartyl protease [Quillaja saponaria]